MDERVVDNCPQKTEPNWKRLTVGGNQINYADTVNKPKAELKMAKLFAVLQAWLVDNKIKWLK